MTKGSVFSLLAPSSAILASFYKAGLPVWLCTHPAHGVAVSSTVVLYVMKP